LAALAVASVVLSFVPWSSNPVSRANFGRIQLGMSQAEVHSLLGKPGIQTVQLGLVTGPDRYVTNFSQSVEECRQRGFRDYQWQQWISTELSIVVVFDLESRVVCRYAGPGEKPYWIEVLQSWLSRWF
jgi:hypothetical protein